MTDDDYLPSFLKDLATLRSPQSPLTFLSYLHSQNRLLPFINRGSFTPSRKEFSDYLSWAARYVEDHGINVRYSEEVVSVREAENGTIEVLSRNVESGETFSHYASMYSSTLHLGIIYDPDVISIVENLILSPGGQAKMPSSLSLLSHPHVLHSSAYATSVESILSNVLTPEASDRPLRIAVVGSGQSSSEVVLDLHNRLSNSPAASGRRCVIDMLFRKGSLKPSDDSPFANEIFDPACEYSILFCVDLPFKPHCYTATEMMYNLPSDHARKEVLSEYRNTNYSVVNPRTIDNVRLLNSSTHHLILISALSSSMNSFTTRSLRTPLLLVALRITSACVLT